MSFSAVSLGGGSRRVQVRVWVAAGGQGQSVAALNDSDGGLELALVGAHRHRRLVYGYEVHLS